MVEESSLVQALVALLLSEKGEAGGSLQADDDPGDTADTEEYCFQERKASRLGIEIAYSALFVAFLGQSIYACSKKAPQALKFDAVMIGGCLMPLAYWLDARWVAEISCGLMLLGSFYVAYALRVMQNIGTSATFLIAFVCIALAFTAVNVINAIVVGTHNCGGEVVEAIGYVGFCLLQITVVAMMFTVR